ncbi:MAG: DUF1801 domain-containing protein [Firmicutes bacterium]|nr:DUF1801 domain-containing protein [Bacillota bacterium]
MSDKNPKVTKFINEVSQWQSEFIKLREVILTFELTEELKWGVPCYSYQGKNVVLIHGFKEYCAILFIKGSLLKDDKKILIQQTKNVQAGRQMRFASVDEINRIENDIKQYLIEAINNEKLGLKVELKKIEEMELSIEFQEQLDKNPDLKMAFEGLTPGRQRAYNLFFLAPKQLVTRLSRIDKCVDKILNGKGLND